MYITHYYVTYVTKENKIVSDHSFVSQKPRESWNKYRNLSPGEISERLFETINSVNNNCQAIINFWKFKPKMIED